MDAIISAFPPSHKGLVACSNARALRCSIGPVKKRYFNQRCKESQKRRVIFVTAASPLSRALQPNLRHFTFAGWFAAFSIVALAAALVYRYLEQKKREALPPDFQDEFMHSNLEDSKEFEIVLASVRQVVTFQRALQSMWEGDTVRAMVELHRVLEENAICRTPLNLTNYTQEDLEDMYRLHLQNSELPLQYATLLHLKQVLSLSDEKARELEDELKSTASFSI